MCRCQVTHESCFIMLLGISGSAANTGMLMNGASGRAAWHTLTSRERAVVKLGGPKQLCVLTVWRDPTDTWAGRDVLFLLIYGDWEAGLICLSSGRGSQSSIIHFQCVTRYSTCRLEGGFGNCSEAVDLILPGCNSPPQMSSWLHAVCRQV